VRDEGDVMKTSYILFALLCACGGNPGDLETELGISKWNPSENVFDLEVPPGEVRHLSGICQEGTHLLAGRCAYEGSRLVVLDPDPQDPRMVVDCKARNDASSERGRIVVFVECAEDQADSP
jgi:hypothetical protein